MKPYFLRLAADYGGILNASLCMLHCAAGPLLVAWWTNSRNTAAAEGPWDVVFLTLSGLLIVGATRRMSSGGLRVALWTFFGVFALTVLLAGRWPWLELVQYVASGGLLITHALNLRYGRRCPVA